jgi:hypothetical protein
MPSILDNKNTTAPSVFRPAALLREARRQRGLASVDVPAICILDPDGDMVRRMRESGEAKPFTGWACYHTQLDTFALAGQTVGVIGCAVGAPFAVLVAEQLFASGCRLLISVTSAGQIRERNAALFRGHRPGIEGRRHKLSLCSLRRIRRGRPATGRISRARAQWKSAARACRVYVDDRRAFSGDSGRDRNGQIKGRIGGRDGGRRALCICRLNESSGALPGPRHQYHGSNWRRF